MSESQKVLRRMPEKGQLTGVCAGLADYTGMDATLVRIIMVALTLATGGGFVVAYILLAIIMPAPTATRSSPSSIAENLQALADDMRASKLQLRLRNVIGFGLIALGAWLLLDQLVPNLIDQSFPYVWPVILILLGIFIATRKKL